MVRMGEEGQYFSVRDTFCVIARVWHRLIQNTDQVKRSSSPLLFSLVTLTSTSYHLRLFRPSLTPGDIINREGEAVTPTAVQVPTQIGTRPLSHRGFASMLFKINRNNQNVRSMGGTIGSDNRQHFWHIRYNIPGTYTSPTKLRDKKRSYILIYEPGIDYGSRWKGQKPKYTLVKEGCRFKVLPYRARRNSFQGVFTVLNSGTL